MEGDEEEMEGEEEGAEEEEVDKDEGDGEEGDGEESDGEEKDGEGDGKVSESLGDDFKPFILPKIWLVNNFLPKMSKKVFNKLHVLLRTNGRYWLL
nr:hypothetical protein CFP56_20118 [Quercus suber]